ncbi:3-hydroxyacyl-CoA dehydrogenase [Agrobacterium sp. ICMP 7243]|nr:3-hydroxyacyl-CoA dehydrogenase [Agrobacterium sp. ICMP 7243]NTG15139.1 3-hydroxyacyl-CoA dehydrogenase [Rhizobium rhizogenes]NTG21969.1 3-hydroxyacyl-CoA dehydrogenase [Rhizobium rhizogenes]NTH39465.1 3-hydroxyacyl-CoA dehydrogenase [Rhizobium rhizogenes]NTJ01868.1 3-hydroxyacyl-CoA dehydrogenase [Rhizobium rhizogenes]
MSEAEARTPATSPENTERLFFLDINDGRILSSAIDGTDLELIIQRPGRSPDGILVDSENGWLYWTEMGTDYNAHDGSIERIDLDGSNHVTLIAPGSTLVTPKQIQIDYGNGKLYWCDREGMRVMRANIDGSDIETLVQNGDSPQDSADIERWCVGIALDLPLGQIYWTQKGPPDAGLGRIFRAGINIPKDETATSRSDIEVLLDRLPEPIDLELDLATRTIYWTDRGNLPRGNTVNRAEMDDLAATSEVVLEGLDEGIGLSLDLPNNRMFFTDIGGNLYSASLDGSGERELLHHAGSFTGIVYAEI